MSTIDLFKSINLDRLFEESSQLSGQIKLNDLQRLTPLLQSTDGVVDFSMHFMQDDASRRIVKITIHSRLMLECQRCLQPMPFEVDIVSSLAVVADDIAAENLPECYEPLVQDGNEVVLGEVIEDELLLKLPLVARHNEVELCVELPKAWQQDPPKTSKKPFAELDTLLRSEKNGSTKE